MIPFYKKDEEFEFSDVSDDDEINNNQNHLEVPDLNQFTELCNNFELLSISDIKENDEAISEYIRIVDIFYNFRRLVDDKRYMEIIIAEQVIKYMIDHIELTEDDESDQIYISRQLKCLKYFATKSRKAAYVILINGYLIKMKQSFSYYNEYNQILCIKLIITIFRERSILFSKILEHSLLMALKIVIDACNTTKDMTYEDICRKAIYYIISMSNNENTILSGYDFIYSHKESISRDHILANIIRENAAKLISRNNESCCTALKLLNGDSPTKIAMGLMISFSIIKYLNEEQFNQFYSNYPFHLILNCLKDSAMELQIGALKVINQYLEKQVNDFVFNDDFMSQIFELLDSPFEIKEYVLKILSDLVMQSDRSHLSLFFQSGLEIDVLVDSLESSKYSFLILQAIYKFACEVDGVVDALRETNISSMIEEINLEKFKEEEQQQIELIRNNLIDMFQ